MSLNERLNRLYKYGALSLVIVVLSAQEKAFTKLSHSARSRPPPARSAGCRAKGTYSGQSPHRARRRPAGRGRRRNQGEAVRQRFGVKIPLERTRIHFGMDFGNRAELRPGGPGSAARTMVVVKAIAAISAAIRRYCLSRRLVSPKPESVGGSAAKAELRVVFMVVVLKSCRIGDLFLVADDRLFEVEIHPVAAQGLPQLQLLDQLQRLRVQCRQPQGDARIVAASAPPRSAS